MTSDVTAVVLTRDQFREARRLLGWRPLRLVPRLFVSEKSIVRFETEGHAAAGLDLALARRVFEAAGVEFIAENGSGPGVRLRKGVQR